MGEIFNITHDDGTLDEYDSFANPTDLAADPAAALADTANGLEVTIDDTDNTYCRKDFVQLAEAAYRLRIYVDPNTLTMGGFNNLILLALRKDTSNRLLVYLQWDGASYEIRVRLLDDNGDWQNTSYYDIDDVQHYIEILVQHAASSGSEDGFLILWLDDEQKVELDELDLYTRTKPNSALVGAATGTHADTSGTFYLDEFVLRDDDHKIGPLAAAPLGFAGIF